MEDDADETKYKDAAKLAVLGTTVCLCSRENVFLKKMDKLLLIWISDQKHKEDNVNSILSYFTEL
jgi:hypothetical protein